MSPIVPGVVEILLELIIGSPKVPLTREVSVLSNLAILKSSVARVTIFD